MTTLLPKPPWACYIWYDGGHIFLELPCPEGAMPYIAKFARTEAGLAKALAVVAQCSNKERSPPPPGYFRHGEAKTPRKGPRTKNDPAPKPSKPIPDPEWVEKARRAMRKVGMA